MTATDAKSTDTDTARGGAAGARLMRLATYASVTIAAILIGVKLFAWLKTGSVALLSSLVDSVLDAGASLINLVAVRHALEPADEEHRFGHGKAEALAGLGQAAFISGSAVFLVLEAAERLINPVVVDHAALGIWVMVLSITLTLGLVIFQRYVVLRTGSTAIKADSLHYKGDLLVNAGIIVALGLTMRFGWVAIDPLFAIAVALYIGYNAWEIGREAFDLLMDREFPNEQREQIVEIALSHPQVSGIHDLRTRSAGVQSFIQLHLELDPDMPLHKAHDVADEVELLIVKAFPGAEVIIHQDPEGLFEKHPEFAHVP